MTRAQDVARGLNEKTTSVTGAPPSAVDRGDNAELDLIVAKKNAAKLEKSVQVFEKQKRGLEVGSSFRAPIGKTQRGITRRAGRPTVGDTVYTVKEFRGRNVIANEGDRSFPISQVMPIPAGTAPVSLAAQRAALRARTAQTRAQRQR